MYKKNIISIAVVIILILIGGGMFWYFKQWKQEDNHVVRENGQEKLDFKTYSNSVIGIEFQYPSSWPILKSNDKGDIFVNNKLSDSFSMALVDLSHLDHYSSKYDNMPIDKQYEIIKCRADIKTITYCEEKVSNNSVKYVWKVYDIGINDTSKAGPNYYAFVATGKYILTFSFQDEDNYNKRAKEYQQLLSTLRIIK
ncbi:MAG: hypothetical protein WC459_05005 [Patescibacteria group bacterium]